MTSVLCYGDVIKLSAKSAHVDGEAGCVGFVEYKGNHQLLVVPPVKDILKDNFVEAEFIIGATRGDKPPAKGTPINYRQPIVLRTSDANGYSLNNKIPGMNDVVGLQPTAVKGEMYISFEKEGFTSETQVHDKDEGVSLNVVDSNRVRKKFNKSLMHYPKAKADVLGGYVSCSKGVPLSFTLIKTEGETTRKFVKNPVFRRASQELIDPVKVDELTRADRVDSDVSEIETASRAGSIVALTPLVMEQAQESLAAEAAASKADKPSTVETAASKPEEKKPEEAASVVVEQIAVEDAAAPAETPVAEEQQPAIAPAFTGSFTVPPVWKIDPVAVDRLTVVALQPKHPMLPQETAKEGSEETAMEEPIAVVARNDTTTFTETAEQVDTTACVGRCTIS